MKKDSRFVSKTRSSVNLEALVRSFMSSMKNEGPKIDP